MANKVRGIETIRVHGDFKKIINRIKARFMMEGKAAPSNVKITKKIADKINKGRFLNEFAKF